MSTSNDPQAWSADAQQLFEQALKLPGLQREVLAEKLFASLHDEPVDPEWEAAWRVEIERRIAELDSGAAKLIPWEEVKKKLWSHRSDAASS
jgi:putative addiction module component (TIGR02574 family)